MHRDFLAADDDARHVTEICVIGCGAAGLSVARRLLALGHEVTLLESGGLDYEAATAALNAGENVGEPYYELEDARLRFFGGTTAIWGGRIAELDPIDFERRDWVPHSGWPIRWDELAPYYDQARGAFGLTGKAATAADMARSGVALPSVDPAALAVNAWSFDPKFDRFSFANAADVTEHARCTVITHASVTELRLDAAGGRIAEVEARALSGRRLVVMAQAFVLAAGGLENPRLLLASRGVAPEGIGNRFDQVGRYFMEHPHARGGRVLEAQLRVLLDAFGRRHKVPGDELAGLLRPSEQLQRERGILNSAATLALRPAPGSRRSWAASTYERIKHSVAPTRRGRALWKLSKRSSQWVKEHTGQATAAMLHRSGRRDLALVMRAEQAPNPASRVRLGEERDTLGMKRIKLDWRLSPLDVRSVSVLVDAIEAEFRRLGLGRVEKSPWLEGEGATWQFDPLVSVHPIGGYHHMGTTRMSAAPQDGVTDGDGRVHGVGNLYVAGSSLFSTAGWANPTLTIVALALRTGERLSAALRHDAR